MFRRLALLGLGALMAVSVLPASGDTRMQAIMQTKLTSTQTLLKAIVTNDFSGIDRAVAALTRINEMEVISWQTHPKRQYTEQAMLFTTAIDDLREASKRRTIEGVGTAYSTLVTTCIHCHAYVRDARSASAGQLKPES